MAKLGHLPTTVRISAVIPARGEVDTLADAVASIQRQHTPVDEIIIAVADEPTKRVALALGSESQPPIKVIDNPGGATATALNAAIAQSKGDVIVRVDAHSVLPDNYVQQALATLRATRAANVGGRQVPTDSGGFGQAVAIAMRSPLGSGGAAYRSSLRPGPVDTVYLGVYRREAIEEVGGFDERFIRNQDAELNERLREHGMLVWFDPQLEVAYRPRDQLSQLARQYLSYGRWRRATARFHPGSLRVRQVASPLLVAVLLACTFVAIVLGSWWPIVAGWGGYAVSMIGAGITLARRPLVALRVAVALATMHLAWGIGFVLGPPRDRMQAPPTSAHQEDA